MPPGLSESFDRLTSLGFRRPALPLERAGPSLVGGAGVGKSGNTAALCEIDWTVAANGALVVS